MPNIFLALAALIRGMDSSHWSGVIDWLKVRSNNIIQFVISKCTEGLDFLDDQYANNRSGCLAQKLPFAAYHFYRHNGNPVGQAEWFHSKIGTGVKVAVADVETYLAEMLGVKRGSDYKTWQAAIKKVNRLMTLESVSVETITKAEAIQAATASLASDVYTFCKWLKDKNYRVVIYSSPGFILSFLQDARLAEFELWIAHVYVSEPTIPAPWAQYGKWTVNPKVPLWQDTWELVVDGVPEAAVDGNLWSPAVGDLYAWFANGEPYSEPSSLPDYVMPMYTNVRIRASVWGTFIAYADKYIAYKVLEEAKDSSGLIWYRIGTSRWIAGWYCTPYYNT